MNPNDALICAKASNAIYGFADDATAEATVSGALAEYNFGNYTWIDLQTIFQDVCAFVATSPDCHLLAFRGTKVAQDWLSDLSCTPVRFDWVFTSAPAVGEIHAGFGHTLSDGLDKILAALTPRDPTKPLLITGHSLGGALAALAGACFTVMGSSVRPVSAIYTFGQPRIGLNDFCNTYSRILANKLVRFVNKQDLVPRVPFRNWDYSDEGTMIHFDSNGVPSVQASEWQNFLARSLQSFGDFFEIISHVSVDVGDHSMQGYLSVVQQSQAALGPLLP
jgi:triacylglycerol lipase